MRTRLPLVLSATALVVALLGSTSLGTASVRLIQSVPPFAKKAGYAKTAGFAKLADNAAAVNGIRAAKTPQPGKLLPLGADGKLPASIGAVGPAGPTGPKGDTGAPGLVRAYAYIKSDGSLDDTRDHKGVVSARHQSAYTCVKLDPSINAARAVPSVTPDLSDFNFTSTGYVAVGAVYASGGCTGSNEIFIGIVGLGANTNGGNPFVGPAAFYVLVP